MAKKGFGVRKKPGVGKGKRRKKSKKKKGKKKLKPEIDPPPIHLLTTLHKKLEYTTSKLYEFRVESRKKRLEGWWLQKEIEDTKNNEVYNNYIIESIDSLEKSIKKIRKGIGQEEKSIQDEIKKLLNNLKKRESDQFGKKEELEAKLSNVKSELSSFDPLITELGVLMERLEEVEKEIELSRSEADIKTRHLKNQYLEERSKLHKHLEAELENLIKSCKSYIFPLLWKHMRQLEWNNACNRWKLAKADSKYKNLVEDRTKLLFERKMLTMGKSYWEYNLTFYKLRQMQTKHSKPKLFRNEPGNGQELQFPSTELARAFTEYLNKRLIAIKGAKERDEKEVKKVSRTNLLEIKSSTQIIRAEIELKNSMLIDDELQWEDYEEEEEEEEEYF